MSYTAWILITATLVGISCSLIGVLLILRRMSMMADAISHTVLLGIVLAYLITRELSGIHMLVGAILAGIFTTMLIGWLKTKGVQGDASIGIVFTTLFAIGVILISTSVGNVHLDVSHTLMGEITFIPWEKSNFALFSNIPKAVVMLSFVLIIVVIIIFGWYKEWKITSFDPLFAASLGIPVVFMHYLFMTMVSVVSVASFDAVGAILVIAMLITPASSAYMWTDRLLVMMGLSVLFGVSSAISGYYVAIAFDTSISGSMAFMTGIIFMISFIFSPKNRVLNGMKLKNRTQ